MSEVETTSLPSSVGSSLVVGFIASHLLLSPPAPSQDEHYYRFAPFVDYGLSPSTHGEYAHLFTDAVSPAVAEPESILDTFYADLVAKQERLGPNFEQVLFENLWNLYAR